MQTKALCRLLLSLVFAFCGNVSLVLSAPKPDPGDAFFTNHTIPRLRIQLDEQALAALRNKFREYTKRQQSRKERTSGEKCQSPVIRDPRSEIRDPNCTRLYAKRQSNCSVHFQSAASNRSPA